LKELILNQPAGDTLATIKTKSRLNSRRVRDREISAAQKARGHKITGVDPERFYFDSKGRVSDRTGGEITGAGNVETARAGSAKRGHMRQ
jgi:hypothetical protein